MTTEESSTAEAVGDSSLLDVGPKLDLAFKEGETIKINITVSIVLACEILHSSGLAVYSSGSSCCCYCSSSCSSELFNVFKNNNNTVRQDGKQSDGAMLLPCVLTRNCSRQGGCKQHLFVMCYISYAQAAQHAVL